MGLIKESLFEDVHLREAVRENESVRVCVGERETESESETVMKTEKK